MGSTYRQQDGQPYLVLNRQTQARTPGIQQLLSDCPGLPGEDCHLFLTGWSAGRESGGRLDSVESSEDGQRSSVLQINEVLKLLNRPNTIRQPYFHHPFARTRVKIGHRLLAGITRL